MARRFRQENLTEKELARFLDAATALHGACCDPRLALHSEPRRVLSALNQEICEAVMQLGQPLPWASGVAAMSGLRRPE